MSTNTYLKKQFYNIDQTLYTMENGLKDYKKETYKDKDAALRNITTFGRAVTSALQKLRGVVGRKEFNDWYSPWQKQLKEDTGFKFLYDLRSQILKEGILETSKGYHVEYLNSDNIDELYKNAPKNAVNFFLGDHTGQSGFTLKMPDGSELPYYINLPKTILANSILEISDFHEYITEKGLKISNTEQLVTHYYRFLAIMVNDAKITFNLNKA